MRFPQSYYWFLFFVTLLPANALGASVDITIKDKPIDIRAEAVRIHTEAPARLTFTQGVVVDEFVEAKIDSLRQSNRIPVKGSKLVKGIHVVGIDRNAFGADFRNGRGKGEIDGKTIDFDWWIGKTIVLSPADGLDYTVVNTRITTNIEEGSYRWFGDIKGVVAGEVSLKIDDKTGNVEGTIYAYDRRFKLLPLPDSDLHIFVEIDPSEIAPRDGRPRKDAAKFLNSLSSPTIQRKIQNVALSLYNRIVAFFAPKAYADLSIPAVVKIKIWRTSEVASGLASSNISTIMSQLATLLNHSNITNLNPQFVDAGQLTGVSTSSDSTVVFTSILNLPTLGSIRGDADLGIVLVDDLTVNGEISCGAAKNLNTPSGRPEESWLALVPTSSAGGCSMDDMRGPHELGHLFGAQHEDCSDTSIWASDVCESTPLPFKYSNGYVQPNPSGGGQFRTVQTNPVIPVGYSNPLPEVSYFSEPNVFISGRPAGKADKAENARTIRLLTPVVAAYRGGGTAGTPDAPDAVLVQPLWCATHLVQIQDDQAPFVEYYDVQASGNPSFLSPQWMAYSGTQANCFFQLILPNIWYRVRACALGNCSAWVLGNQPAAMGECGGF